MERKEKLNLAMLFDFYEMTMANGYFRRGWRVHHQNRGTG